MHADAREDVACIWLDREQLLGLTVALDTILVLCRASLSPENLRLLVDLRQQVREHL
jgi:hypothetical protein